MKKKLIYLLAAMTLVAAVCGAGPTQSGAAPFDPNNTEGSMTIRPMEETDQAMAEDVLKTNAVVDVFRVAKAEKTPGYDTYHYVYGAPFDGVFGINDQTPENADDWDAMAQEAAKVVFDKNVSRLKQGDLKGTVEGLEPGLYLLMARGGTAADSVADFRKDVTDDKGNTTIVTYANSPEYEYTFKPQLISLPMKGNRVPVNPTDPPNTADSGDWNYNLEVYLKFERSVRYGSLTIRKVLSSYESETDIPNDPVTFVFQVDGETQGTAENSGSLPSYHAVDSLTFTAAGEDTVTFEKIPVTLKLTVREVYSGSGYEIAPGSSLVQEGIEISAGEPTVLEIPFINVHNDDLKRGHGIKNQFTYESNNPDDPTSGGAWGWESEPSQN